MSNRQFPNERFSNKWMDHIESARARSSDLNPLNSWSYLKTIVYSTIIINVKILGQYV